MGWVLNATPEVNSVSQWPKIITVAVVLCVLSSAVVITRLCIRYRARGLAGDDWMSVLSMAFAIIYSALCIARMLIPPPPLFPLQDLSDDLETRYGLGLPVTLRPEENLVTYTRVNFAGRPFYQIGISFFKIALLISYLRLLNGTDHSVYRIVVWVTIGFVFLSHLGCTLSLIFACSPVSITETVGRHSLIFKGSKIVESLDGWFLFAFRTIIHRICSHHYYFRHCRGLATDSCSH